MTTGHRSSARGRTPAARLLLYTGDTFGLGHLRRTLAIAGELARRRPDAALLALTGSPQAHAYELPPNFDYIKLPTATKRRLYRNQSPRLAPAGALTGIWDLRETLIQRTAHAFQPHLLLVDHTPAGAHGELIRTLACLRAADPRVELVLGLRDIDAAPAWVRARWLERGVYELLDQTYDRILVYGQQEVFDPVSEYGLSPVAAAKTVFCGYVRRPELITPAAVLRARLDAGDDPFVVVAAGGGRDGGSLMRTYLEAARGGALAGVTSLLITGPLLAPADLIELEAVAGACPGVTLVPFINDLVSYLNAADVVVTMGGYNTLCEAVSLGKRVIVVPRIRFGQEQLIRAERFAALGLVSLVHPNDLTPERLADAVEDELSAASSPPSVLSFDGLRRAGDVLVDALRQSTNGH